MASVLSPPDSGSTSVLDRAAYAWRRIPVRRVFCCAIAVPWVAVTDVVCQCSRIRITRRPGAGVRHAVDERDWFCEQQCGVLLDTEARPAECAGLDIDYGIGAIGPPVHRRLTAAW
ncbi:MAG: hypothetical protein LC808_05335 [Actinobacteria bacterium]|nr:hypothetical protein [Actinomycetota bacterium]